MKDLFKAIASLALLLGILCAGAQHTPNYPLPQQPDTLRILGIGNSFTDDGMMYLPELLEAAGIKNVILGRLYIGGCSLERHCKEYDGNKSNYIYYKSVANKWETISDKASLLDGMHDENWDIFVIQQSSPKSGIYETYQPWLNKLIEIIRWNSTNAGATIAWQQTWAYSKDSNHGEFPRYERKQELMFNCILSATEKLMKDTSISTIIPSGTAIQIMRGTEFNDELDLTRDGYHLSEGMGRYTAACAWFQTLVAPCFKTTLTGNPARLEGSPHELSPEAAKACQEAVRKACINPFLN